MPITRKQDGWYYGSKGPFPTKAKALQVAGAIHAVGGEEINEKRQKDISVALDYHNTYSADPKFWDTFIYMCWMRKWTVYCVTHHTGQDQNDKLMDSLGKILDKDHIIFTMGKAKQPFVKELGIDIDIWIDNNPEHIINDPQ
jgi:hypothetical protein